MIEVHISYTLRSPHPDSEWTMVHETANRYADMAEARAALKAQYPHVKKRTPMYCDTKSRGTIQSGYIYHYKDKNDRTGKVIYCQDWASFYERTDSTQPYRSVDVKHE